MDVNSLFCLCSKIIISDVEKLNKCVCVCVQITWDFIAFVCP